MDRFEVPARDDGARLVDVAREHLAVVAAREVGPLIGRGGVEIDGRPGAIAEPVRAGQVLTVAADALAELADRGRVTEPSRRPLTILFEDADVLIVDKPSGTHVHPMGPYRDDTLVGSVLWHAGARPDSPWAAWRPYPAHRLDRATSGALAFATSRPMQDRFRVLFQEGAVSRTYHATVQGQVGPDAVTVREPLGRDPDNPFRRAVVPVDAGGQDAVSHVRVLERLADQTRVEVRLETGRTHQIRAHLASVGHAIVGDTLYVPGSTPVSASTIELRAVRLGFPHPRTGEPVLAIA